MSLASTALNASRSFSPVQLLDNFIYYVVIIQKPHIALHFSVPSVVNSSSPDRRSRAASKTHPPALQARSSLALSLPKGRPFPCACNTDTLSTRKTPRTSPCAAASRRLCSAGMISRTVLAFASFSICAIRVICVPSYFHGKFLCCSVFSVAASSNSSIFLCPKIFSYAARSMARTRRASEAMRCTYWETPLLNSSRSAGK